MTYSMRNRLRGVNAYGHPLNYIVDDPSEPNSYEGAVKASREIPYKVGETYIFKVLVESVTKVSVPNKHSKTKSHASFDSDQFVLVVQDELQTRLSVNISAGSAQTMAVGGVYQLTLKIKGTSIKKVDIDKNLDAYASRVSPYTITNLSESPEQFEAQRKAEAEKEAEKRRKEAENVRRAEEHAKKTAERIARRKAFPVDF
jgi:regulator of protease activity HflC (stomatin/prohibitin superfamily)